jgi:flavin reductase (DIM6/NTAB) family NADH-FMN oxidoreductase RutF
VDKFKEFHLTPGESSCVKAPRIEECYVNLECKVVDARMAARYNLFILEVLQAWIDPGKKNPRTIHHRGKGAFMVSGKTIDLPSRMK